MIPKLARCATFFGLAAMLTMAVLRPADSVEVERGAALFLLPFAVLTWCCSSMGFPVDAGAGGWVTGGWKQRREWLFDAFGWGLVVWLGVAVLSLRGTGNLREGVNEWWWWCTWLLLVVAGRRAMQERLATRGFMCLIVALTLGLSTFAAYQQWVSLPADRARYEADPDAVLQAADIVAPEGSPQRMIFEARLYGGGPTGTFALANSLAGFLVMGIPLSVGVILLALKVPKTSGAVVVAGVVVCFSIMALVWTDSRSANVSLLVGIATGCVQVLTIFFTSSVISKRLKPWLKTVWIAMFAVACTCTIAIAWIPAVWGLVPRSLAFRFQYWNATLRMVSESVWFGAAPGNFQQRYGRYRLEDASESIADPHNWLMELLASGGVLAGFLFLAAAVVGVVYLYRPERSGAQTKLVDVSAGMGWCIGLGALFGFVAVFAYWISIFQLPEFDAIMLAAAATVGVYLGLWRTVLGAKNAISPELASRSEAMIDVWAVAAVTAIGVHLLASGGFTVPGVAVPMGILIGVVLRQWAGETDAKVASRASLGLSRRTVATASFGAVFIAGWFLSAWHPASRSAALLDAGMRAAAQGREMQAIDSFQEAEVADAWDPLPSLRIAEVLVWRLVSADGPEASNKDRVQHANATGEAMRRDEGSGQIKELAARHSLMLYQRWGEEADLVQAEQLLREAVQLGPTEVGWIAQLAGIRLAAGDLAEARQLRQRAELLSLAGGHSDRQLDVVQVMPAEWIGESVRRQGFRTVSANVLFSEPGWGTE
jgi:O-antigen ligase